MESENDIPTIAALTSPFEDEPVITPLVFSDTLDTKKHVLLIDSSISNKQIFYDNVNSDTFPIIYDYNSDKNELLLLLKQKFSSIQRISFVFHGKTPDSMVYFLNNQPFFQDSDLYNNQTNLSDNVSFLIRCIQEFNVAHIDFLACNTLQYSNWKSYYSLLSSRTSVVIGASNNNTGNIHYGGDWIMENTYEDIKNIYFNEHISDYASTLVETTISANGSSGSIYLQMNGLNIEYYFGTGPTGTYTTITNWPVKFVNTNSNPSSTLNVIFNGNLSISNDYGNTAGYFIAGSDNITFDGQNYNINISGITNYPGFVQNGTNSANGKNGIIVQNIITAITTSTLNSPSSTLAAGWICAASFGRGATGNVIQNCVNNGPINNTSCGGICGNRLGVAGGNVSVINCSNSGEISSFGAGGIAGYRAGESGIVTFTNCSNSGSISGSQAGGIVGQQSGQSGSATFTNCSNTGSISGVNAGGIAGRYAGYSGIATFTTCSNTGLIGSTDAGGIAGSDAGQSGIATFTNCSNTGSISGKYAGGIAGYSPGNTNGTVTFTTCSNSGTISGEEVGGIAGSDAGYLYGTATFTTCSNSGTISGKYAGGIAGKHVGQSGIATFTSCSNSGTISGQEVGGIAGSYAGKSGTATFTTCSNSGTISGKYAGGIAGTAGGYNNGTITITKCYNIGNISNDYAGGIAGDWFAHNTNNTCSITYCYNTGNITGSHAGGIVGAEVGYTDAIYNPIVNIIDCYSQGTIATTAGGICGGSENHIYHVTPTVTISNCYALGTTGTNGIIADDLQIKTSITVNYCYVTYNNTTWSDSEANSNLLGYPTLETNPGTIWTSVVTNSPYVLSAFNSAIYNPSSASTNIFPYTTSNGLFTPDYIYSIIKSSQVLNEFTVYVFVSKGEPHYYNSYNCNTFTLTNTTTTPLLSIINSDNGQITINYKQTTVITSPYLSSIQTYGDPSPFSLDASSNNTETPIVYSSSNQSVATVDASGNVTILDTIGNADIIMSQVETTNYKSGFVKVFVINPFLVNNDTELINYLSESNITYGNLDNTIFVTENLINNSDTYKIISSSNSENRIYRN